MQATARIYFQKAPAKRTKDDLCPVKLVVTHNRIRKYYSVSEVIKDPDWQFLPESEIERVTGDNPRGKYRDIAFEFKRITDEAERIINSISTFSFNQFEEKFFHRLTTWDNVFMAMIDHIKTLKAEERFSYALTFASTLRAIKEFHEGRELNFNCRDKIETRYKDFLSGKSLNFVDITPTWLKKFELHLQKHDKSKSTLGVYVRNIRVIFNLAIKEHKIKAEYPFTIHKPKTSQGRKIALTAHQISQLANYETTHPQEQFYRDIFMFIFLANGMNLSDLARLRYSNIQDGEIVFVREKTKNKEAREEKLHVPITKHMQTIIDRHGNKAIGYDSYLFPILKLDWSEEKKFTAVRQLIKKVNSHIKHIAKATGINENVSSYVARHSWATIAKNSGTSTEFISEALGHSSVKVTKGYLKSFEKSTREEHSQKMESVIYNQNAV